MSSDIVCEEVGTISRVRNRILWTIPNFYELEKNIRFKSPQFSLIGSIWQLRYCFIRSTLNSKEWLDIGVKLLSMTVPFEKQRVRFGIAGYNVEISKTLESNIYPKYHSLTLPCEDEIYAWIPEGNLRLFLTIEKSEDELLGDTFLQINTEIVNTISEQTDTRAEVTNRIESAAGRENFKHVDQNAMVDVSTQTEDTGEWKLPVNFEEYLLSGNVSDLVLKVGDEEFKSHRCILAARSPVFLDMMMQEINEQNTQVVEVQNTDSNTFSAFHNYLYTGNVGAITTENAYKLYSIAHTYKVDELQNICMDHMLENICAGNFCDIMTLSLLHEKKDLIEACSEFFMKNSLDIITTSKWEAFLSDNPVVGNGLYVRLLQMKK